jgi:NAD(P)-dependent dehydrogenase (short-subunit alcohol dehydrogenase family)
MEQQLTNKVIIVTGGNSGIGYYGIQKFLELGAKVIMASRDEKRALLAIKELPTLLQSHVKFIELNLKNR